MTQSQKDTISILVFFALVLGALFLVWVTPVRLGLDLRGGMLVVLAAKPPEGGKVTESEVEYLILPKEHLIDIGFEKTCSCEGNKINCLTAKEWLKHQLGVWEFYYEKRDIRDKEVHPATFPISIARPQR